ncbi:hypothetical protein [Pseudomonas sp. RL]|uniref:hypothetical protein n=1 Tax=Pseudomonas sp. RL TaxID=1452718 RepID=UPI0012DE39D6|nr:hypothetical protein [Pseudomonas sp. RL]
MTIQEITSVIDKTNFYTAIEDLFIPFPEKITCVSEEGFRRVYDSEHAKEAKNIVYLFRCEKKISRLKGESNIIYIGQTKHSFYKRYHPHAKLHATSPANSLKFSHIIENYGPISISTCSFLKFGENILLAEGQLLWWYFQNHCEYPPVNYTKTKVRNSAVCV